MTTRAAAAANSKRIKQHLVNLLFKSEHARKGWVSHSKLDSASYSYSELKLAYLERIQFIHPDKILHSTASTEGVATACTDTYTENNIVKAHSGETSQTNNLNTTSWDESYDYNRDMKWDSIIKRKEISSRQQEFVKLQQAWDEYDKITRQMRRGYQQSEMRGVQENFTLFGVGCSFSDSVEESQKRAMIMDQASRGWIAAGQLVERNEEMEIESNTDQDNKNANAKNMNFKQTKLIDDELFNLVTESKDEDNDVKTIKWGKNRSTSRSRSLIDHLIPKNHKRP
mmetsp:Transcript_486/g.677  ORF Transcript_486/g.677 Transcript_486/m.677 type:complete len:284 (-) Transcript_486:169-1020(-)